MQKRTHRSFLSIFPFPLVPRATMMISCHQTLDDLDDLFDMTELADMENPKRARVG
jgi:hypothetical protein